MKRSLSLSMSLGVLFAGNAFAQQGAKNGEWHYWGGDAGATRYSALSQINADNAKNLEIAWRWPALAVGQRADTNWQATPLFIDGVLYVTSGVHQAVALDPATGKTLWVFNPEPKDLATGRSGNPSGRSMAYWTDGKEKRLFRSTLDGFPSTRRRARPIRSLAKMAM
jgi:glucose dehydrogenase